jgi:hypothetical protein
VRDIDRRADIQPRISEDSTESNGIAVLFSDQRGAFANPTQAGARGNGLERKSSGEGLFIDIFTRYLE